MPIQVILSDLTFRYSGALEVFKEVSFALGPGWTGLVGPNGSGKTTLLRILAGELTTDPSALQRIPADQVIRYCPQRVGELSPLVHTLADRWDGFAQRLKGVLSLSPQDLTRWPSLSPGERKRWQIAAALVDRPDLLLLDEPTNHLDPDARELLTDELKGFGGIGVLVSHDRELLDLLTTETLRISAGGHLKSYGGGYSDARKIWTEEEEQTKETLERLQATRRDLKRRLDSTRQSHRAAEAKTSTGSRMKGPRDSDARSMAAKGRAASGERSLGRRVTLQRKELDRVREKGKNVHLEKEVGRSIFVLEDPSPRPTLVHLKTPVIRRGDLTVLEEVDRMIRRETRVHLRGRNGAGKTTLIQEFLGACSLPPERVLHLPQELSQQTTQANLEEMRALPDDKKGRLLQIVAALGVPPERLLSTDSPSPGEARKLAMAMGLTRQAWLLMLDEPTNHLDLPSIERIEDALKVYSSALVLVTHDTQFAVSLTSDTWTIRDGRVFG